MSSSYNYQYAQKGPGTFAHNGKYMFQVRYSSAADPGIKVQVDMTKLTRP